MNFKVAAWVAVFVSGVCFLKLALDKLARSSEESCWRDPHPTWDLDFDFHTGIDGKPSRCGYLPARGTSNLPRVLGEQIRAEISDFMCYPLERVDCSKVVKPGEYGRSK